MEFATTNPDTCFTNTPDLSYSKEKTSQWTRKPGNGIDMNRKIESRNMYKIKRQLERENDIGLIFQNVRFKTLGMNKKGLYTYMKKKYSVKFNTCKIVL